MPSKQLLSWSFGGTITYLQNGKYILIHVTSKSCLLKQVNLF